VKILKAKTGALEAAKQNESGICADAIRRPAKIAGASHHDRRRQVAEMYADQVARSEI